MFPYYCLVCRRRLRRSYLCRCCRPQSFLGVRRCQWCFTICFSLDEAQRCEVCRLQPLPYRLRYLWEYEGKAQSLISKMKYAPSPKLCKEAGQIMAQQLESVFSVGAWDVIMPVPSSKRSLCERGFNQCLIMAKEVAKLCHSEINIFDLTQIKQRATQASLPYKKRILNVRNSFKSTTAVQGKTILLIDDVSTTGATLLAASQALYEAGAFMVDSYVLARSKTWISHRDALGHIGHG